MVRCSYIYIQYTHAFWPRIHAGSDESRSNPDIDSEDYFSSATDASEEDTQAHLQNDQANMQILVLLGIYSQVQ